MDLLSTGANMKRRAFIALVGGAAAAWPLAAHAQQPAIPVIGWLRAGRPATADRLTAFRQGLNDLGYIEGRDVAVERKDSDQYDRLPELASELVRDQVTTILPITLPQRLRPGLRPRQFPSSSPSVATRSGTVSSPASADRPATSRG